MNIKGPRSETPLQAARKAGHSKIVQLLVDAEQEQANAEQNLASETQEQESKKRSNRTGSKETNEEGLHAGSE